MKHKQETRRVSARGRRLEDIKRYDNLLKNRVPQTLYDKSFDDQAEWDKIIHRKRSIAKKDVDVLDLVLDHSMNTSQLDDLPAETP